MSRRYLVTRAQPAGYRPKVGRPRQEDVSLALPSPEGEAAGLLRDINPLHDAQVEATVALIRVTPRQQAILYHLTTTDPAGRRLVDIMLTFRARVLDRFVEGVQAARLSRAS